MEKPSHQNHNCEEAAAKTLVWDCGSSLYDSFELKSFKRQLDSAMASRTLSMPHLCDRPPPPPPPAVTAPATPKKSSKFSRSFHKLLRSFFRLKPNTASFFRVDSRPKDGFYVFHDRSGALSTIPEVPEICTDYGGLSPELNSLVRRSASERFTAASIGISCA